MKKAGLLTTATTVALLSFSSPTLAEEVDQPVMEVNQEESLESGANQWLPDIPDMFQKLLGFVWGGP
ncbi:MAG: hypothetical protein AB8G18_01060 [Gammaproteobacteria bacterium]